MTPNCAEPFAFARRPSVGPRRERRASQTGNESEWQVTKGCSKDNSLRQGGAVERLNHAHCGILLDAVLNQHTPVDSHTDAMYFCIACYHNDFEFSF